MKKVIGRKAEWLKGDGEAWINTGYKANPETVVNIRFKPYDISVDRSIYGARVSFNENSIILGISSSALGSFWSDRRDTDSAGNRCTLPLSSNIELENINSPTSIVIGNSVFKINTQPSINTRDIFLFWSNGGFPYDKFDGAIQYFKIDKISLSPIVLASSIPPSLASDNLPHAAGECGMWDSVNEKFYGNANSVGAFSVENELDEYVEVDLTGICINGKYQRVAVENTEIPQIVWNGVNARMLMLNGKVVWSNVLLKVERYELYEYLTASAGAFVTTDIQETENSEIYAEVVFDSNSQRTVVIRQGSELISLISTEANNKIAPYLKSYRVSSGSYYYGFALSSSKSFTLGEAVRLVFSAKWNKDSHQIDVSESYMSANNEVLTLKYTQAQLNAVAELAGYALINVGSIDIFSKQNVSNPKLSCYIQKNECELRPCRKVIRNVKDGTERYEIGILDKVTKKFYGNSGNGELFVEGNIIETIVI